MHPQDIMQKFNVNGTPIYDNGISFEELHQVGKGKYILGGSSTVIYRRNEGKIELLFQQRSEKMLTNPGKWDIHGGYINLGETPIDTVLREVKEELDLDLNPEKLQFAFRLKQINEICSYYLYDITDENQEIHFVDGEAQATKWVDFETFKYRKEEIGLKEPLLVNKFFFELITFMLEQNGNLDK